MSLSARTENLRRTYPLFSSFFGWPIASQLVTSGANFFTTLIIVRSLGLLEFGRFSLCFLVLMISRNFLGGVVLSAMSTIMPKLSERAQKTYRAFLALQISLFAVGTSLLLYVLALLLGSATNAPWLVDAAAGLALANLFANSADFFRRYNFVQNASSRAFMIDVVRFGVQFGLLLILAVFWPDVFTVTTAFFALAVGAAFGALVGLFNFGETGWNNRFARTLWPRHINFIKWQSPSVVLETLQSNIPLFIGAALLGEAVIGVVRAVQSLTSILILPFYAMQQIAPSLAARAFSTHGHQGLRAILTRMAVGKVVLLVTLSVPAILLSPVILVNWFGMEVKTAMPVLLLFCLLNIALVLRLPFMFYFQTLERPNILAMSEALGFAVSFGVTLTLIVPLGIYSIPFAFLSAAIAIIICLCVIAVQSNGTSSKTVKIRRLWLPIDSEKMVSDDGVPTSVHHVGNTKC